MEQPPAPGDSKDTDGAHSTAPKSSSSDFDNQSFWESRYTTDIDRGSGSGSRGRFLDYKRGLLDRLLAEFQPTSILDVGCGDIEVTKDIPFSGAYTGLDLSPSVIARNRSIRPDWTFLEGDFLELVQRDGLHADLVLGFDVLIHQHDAQAYRSFVKHLIGAADKVAVMNGFENVANKRVGNNVAFHEPLTRTVSEAGAVRMRRGDRFRRTLIVLVVNDDAASARAPEDQPSA